MCLIYEYSISLLTNMYTVYTYYLDFLSQVTWKKTQTPSPNWSHGLYWTISQSYLGFCAPEELLHQLNTLRLCMGNQALNSLVKQKTNKTQKNGSGWLSTLSQMLMFWCSMMFYDVLWQKSGVSLTEDRAASAFLFGKVEVHMGSIPAISLLCLWNDTVMATWYSAWSF